jgi:hypothetical protein
VFFHLLLKSMKEIMLTYSCEIHSQSSGVGKVFIYLFNFLPRIFINNIRYTPNTLRIFPKCFTQTIVTTPNFGLKA